MFEVILSGHRSSDCRSKKAHLMETEVEIGNTFLVTKHSAEEDAVGGGANKGEMLYCAENFVGVKTRRGDSTT
ncbi:hypothetical protein AB3S75_001067 [Citrus x aurantiifolia]